MKNAASLGSKASRDPPAAESWRLVLCSTGFPSPALDPVTVPLHLAACSRRDSGSPRVSAGPVGFHGLCEFVLVEKMPQICSDSNGKHILVFRADSCQMRMWWWPTPSQKGRFEGCFWTPEMWFYSVWDSLINLNIFLFYPALSECFGICLAHFWL